LAKAGTLTVLCSGPKPAYDKTLPLFEKLSAKQFYLGDGDGARAMKLGLNMMIATSLQMLAESLTLCEKAGIEWNTALDVIGGSVLASPLISYKIPPIKERKYDPAFSTRLMAKDLDLALSVGKQLGVCAPATALTKQMLEANIAKGKGEADFSSLIPLIEELSGL
jgi:3-hydroxyisobutyrate dehydrogenase